MGNFHEITFRVLTSEGVINYYHMNEINPVPQLFFMNFSYGNIMKTNCHETYESKYSRTNLFALLLKTFDISFSFYRK